MSTTAERPKPEHGAAVDPFRQIAEAAPIGIVHTTATGVGLFVNQAWRDLTGSPPHPDPYEMIQSIVHPDDRERVVGLYLEAAETLEAFETELRLVRPDGEVRHVRIQGQPHLVDGELHGFTGTALDVTDVVEANQARTRSDNRYQKLIAKAPIGQAVYSLDLRMVEINEAGAALVGATPADLIGMRADELLSEHDRSLMIGPMPRPAGRTHLVVRDRARAGGAERPTALGEQHRHRRARRRRPTPALPLAHPGRLRAQAGRGPAAHQRGPLPEADRRGAGGPARLPARRRAGRGQPGLPRHDG